MFKERIYKIWKQFTTAASRSCRSRNCVQRTNIQNLKAIHNYRGKLVISVIIVFKERIYKIWKQFTTTSRSPWTSGRLCSKNEYTKSESNSQHMMWSLVLAVYCVQRTNIQNLKAIHNRRSRKRRKCPIVFKERIYKIWKQFTTTTGAITKLTHCVQRTNIQNLKAIHNYPCMVAFIVLIVFKERIYKIWKQFTTGSITMSIFRPFQLLGFFNSINKRKISIDKSCNY